MTRADLELDKVTRWLGQGEVGRAQRALQRLRERAPGSRARSLAEIEWLLGVDHDETGALDRLERHVEAWPDDADARHLLGQLWLERDRPDVAGVHWSHVRAIDARRDRAAGVGSPADEAFVARAAEDALEALPEPFRSDLAAVPVVVEERPSEELVASGFDPRAYGLFEGPTHEVARSLEAPPLPSRIVVYVANLAADFGSDEALRQQVEITVGHEVGHYFGLEEDDMVRLGLD